MPNITKKEFEIIKNVSEDHRIGFLRYQKYLVLKLSDIDEVAPKLSEQRIWLDKICRDIEAYRNTLGKKQNNYIVVNEDEPYSEKVWVLIRNQVVKDAKREAKDANL